jgi:hypothetical protein
MLHFQLHTNNRFVGFASISNCDKISYTKKLPHLDASHLSARSLRWRRAAESDPAARPERRAPRTGEGAYVIGWRPKFDKEKPPMTDEQRALIYQSAYRLRSRLTLMMLCSHTLKLDLRDVLTRDHEKEFQQMDRILDEAKAVLNTLLKQLEQECGEASSTKRSSAKPITVRVEPAPAV